MRVLLATSLRAGGPLEHSLLLARHLVAMEVEVTASCADAAVAERFAATGATAVELPLDATADLRGGARLERLARRHDVVHAQDRRCGLWTRIWPRRGGPARVYTVHGLPDPYLPLPDNDGRRPRPRDRLAYQGLDAWLARRSDAVVVPSRALAALLVARLGFPAAKLEVIPNGVEIPAAPLAAGEVVGTVSLLGPVKGLDTFLVAAASVAARFPGQRFAIVGDGPDRAALEAAARERGLPIEFPGMRPIADLLPTLRIFVLPSLFENCPMSLLEAMAAGVPAVASAVGGVPELAGDAALLVPPADAPALAGAIEGLLADPARREALGARGRARGADHVGAAANARALLGVYERVTGRR
ncbi:MAG TPA: glycosyltransferase family 4 protein [Solirubrobacterales bacterium]|nr:glycosyltransferase family 4 protein [Solirubrobacterales bacterium]